MYFPSNLLQSILGNKKNEVVWLGTVMEGLLPTLFPNDKAHCNEYI